jgi:hypothetical protein
MKAHCLFGLAFLSSAALLVADPLPAPWKDQDIGEASKTPGSAAFENGVFTLQGCMNILNNADGCHMVWQPLHGDGEIVARVNSIEKTAFHAKASIGIRESLEPGARHATMAVTPTDGTLFLMRVEANGKTSNSAGKEKGRFPCWLKVVRHGKEFTGYESGDGENWTRVGKVELEIGPDTVVGLCTSSHLDTKLAKATFDNVKFTVDEGKVK